MLHVLGGWRAVQRRLVARRGPLRLPHATHRGRSTRLSLVQPPRASADSPPAACALDKCTARRPYLVRHAGVGEYVARSHALIYEAAVLTTAVARSRRSYYRTLLDPCFRPSAGRQTPGCVAGADPVLGSGGRGTPLGCYCPADVAAAFHLA